MKALIGFVLYSAALSAAVEGTVQNATAGKPQAGALVTLVELSEGMNNVGSVKTDAQGRFQFNHETKAQTPYLIQALHQGVTYNRMLPPGSAAGPVTLDVYDASARVPEAKVSQDMILIEKSGDQLIVNETVIFSNPGRRTYQDPEGTLKIQTPKGAGPVKMRITAPQGMPISRDPEPGDTPGAWVVKYPVKPGETRLDFSYTMPASGDPTRFAGRILHGGGPVRFVAPAGVKLVSPALTDLGPEPRTQATVYELKGSEFSIDVSGAGQLRPAFGNGDETKPTSAGESDTPGIEIVKPKIFTRLPWVVGLTFAMLAIGFVSLFRKSAGA